MDPKLYIFFAYAESPAVQACVDRCLQNKPSPSEKVEKHRMRFLHRKLGRLPEAHESYFYLQVSHMLELQGKKPTFQAVVYCLTQDFSSALEPEAALRMSYGV